MVDQFANHVPEFDMSSIATFDDARCEPSCNDDMLCLPANTRGCSDDDTEGIFVIDKESQMLNALDDGVCSGVVMFSDSWDKKRTTGFHCNKFAAENLFGVSHFRPCTVLATDV